MSIEKLTSIMIFSVEPFVEIDNNFNWINSLKQYGYIDRKQREIKTMDQCIYNLQKIKVKNQYLSKKLDQIGRRRFKRTT